MPLRSRPLLTTSLLLAGLLSPLASGAAATETARVDPAKLGDLVADPGLFPLTPDNVRDKLAPVVALKPGEPYEGSWAFLPDKADPEVPLAQVQFTEHKKGQWALSQLQVMIKPAEGKSRDFYDAVTRQVHAKLGKHASAKNGPPDARSTVWKLKKGMRLWVEERRDPQAGKLVEVRLAAPQGEPD
jgi:hypothetical protein